MPWIAVSCSSPPPIKSVGIAILHQTGYFDIATRATEHEIWRIARHRLD